MFCVALLASSVDQVVAGQPRVVQRATRSRSPVPRQYSSTTRSFGFRYTSSRRGDRRSRPSDRHPTILGAEQTSSATLPWWRLLALPAAVLLLALLYRHHRRGALIPLLRWPFLLSRLSDRTRSSRLRRRTREPRPAPTARRVQAEATEAFAQTCRPSVLGSPHPAPAHRARGDRDRQTRNGRWLASIGLEGTVAMEIEAARSPAQRQRNPRLDPQDSERQPKLGRAQSPLRNTRARLRRRRTHRLALHAEETGKTGRDQAPLPSIRRPATGVMHQGSDYPTASPCLCRFTVANAGNRAMRWYCSDSSSRCAATSDGS